MRTSNVRSTTVLAALLLCTTIPAVADEADLDKKQTFDIGPQSLASALLEFSDQADVQILVAANDIQGHRTEGVQGQSSPREALDVLLQHTELGYSAIGSTISVTAKDLEAEDPGNARTTPRPMMMAQASMEESSRNQGETEGEEKKQGLPIEEIVVTGTNIRGIAPASSPVRIFDREDIKISGAGTAQDFIQTLTANFGGGSNANVPPGLPNDTTGGSNSVDSGSYGSSVNLRGLGSTGTLVLLNGHRLAPGSIQGDFVDISMIPASAIERVEVLTDGASSIYGSDAVAGVVNFILRDDFDGLETALRYGTSTQHGTPDQYRASITGGRNWDSGHALLVYEFFNQEQLSVEDRKFARKDFLPNFLLPSQRRHSILASAIQNVTPGVELFADFSYSTREAHQLRTQFDNGLTVQHDATSDNLNIAAGGTWQFSGDWFFDFSGVYSKVKTRNLSSLADSDDRVTDSNMWAGDAKLSGSLLHLPGGDIKVALGGHYRKEALKSEETVRDVIEREAKRDIYALFGEVFIPVIGPDNDIPGFERLELNISGRLDDYSDFGSSTNPKIGALWSPIDGLNFRGSYSTSFLAPPLGRVGAMDFEATVARTSFINSIFGLTAADPSIADVVSLTLSGTAPDLDPETSRALTAGFDVSQQWGRHSVAISATWFDIEFENRLGRAPVPGNVTAFDAPNIAFRNPNAFPEGTVVFSPTQEELRDLIENLDDVFAPFGDNPFDAQIINYAIVTRNLSRTMVDGFDLELAYTTELNNHSLLLGLDGTFLRDIKRQAAATTPLVETVNTLFNPVDLKLRGRAAYFDDNFAVNAFFNYVNDYSVDSTTNAEPIESWTTVDLSFSYDTKEKFGNSLLSETVFRISVINLFDKAPPKVPTFSSLRLDGYDPTNASPLGRFASFEVTKRW